MGFELFCAAMIALLFGLAIIYGGYRLFMVLLPIWGFVFGFALGAQTLQYLFGIGFLATLSSWIVGFLVGGLFAVLSYFIYLFGVCVLAGSLGYALGVSLMLWIGLGPGFVTWMVGFFLAIVMVAITLGLNLQKYVIIIATAIIGSGLVIGTLMFGILAVPLARLLENPIRTVLDGAPIMTLLFLVLVGTGIYAQIKAPPVAKWPEEEKIAPVPQQPPAAAAPVAVATVVAAEKTHADPEAAIPSAPAAVAGAAAVAAIAAEPEEAPVSALPAVPEAAVIAALTTEPEEAPISAPPVEGKVAESPITTPVARPKVPIDTIEGIGPVYKDKLKEIGILYVADLLDAGASRKGREDLVGKTGISAALVLKWVNMADLMRISGVGEEFSELLEAAGVDTVKELRNRNPENLHQAMLQANQQRKMVGRIPHLSEVQSWVERAKQLDPVMTY